jgi:penicillin-binding protein activator
MAATSLKWGLLVLILVPATALAQSKKLAPGTRVVLAPTWSDQDSKDAARALLPDLLRRRAGKLRIWLAPLRNRTSHHINTSSIGQPFKQALAASKRVKLVDRNKQPKLVLEGVLLSQDDAHKMKQLNALYLHLQLVKVASHEVVWAGGHWARRLVERIPPGKRKPGQHPLRIKRLKPGKVMDLSGHFNDTDATSTARAAAKDLLGSGWLSRASKPPVLRLYPLRNRSAERITHQLITGQLAAALVRSGKVRLVAAPGAAVHAASVPGRELGATHVVSGKITLVVEGKVRMYRVSFNAVDVDSSAKTWIFSRPIKKIVTSP